MSGSLPAPAGEAAGCSGSGRALSCCPVVAAEEVSQAVSLPGRDDA